LQWRWLALTLEMPHASSFFLPGACTDRGYANVRDSTSEICQRAREFTEFLWERYHSFADPNFRTDAKNHFLQRFWEMYLYCSLAERGFNPKRVGHEGPEFYFEYGTKKIWVEAIAPGPGTGEDAVPENPGDGEVRSVPTEKILLRFTHAMRDKLAKYKKDLAKGIVSSTDSVLLCINSRGIPDAPYGDDLPYFVKAFLPLGNLQVSINLKTMEATRVEHQFRGIIQKAIGSPVSTENFMQDEMSPFVAVLHSSVDCANNPTWLGGDFSILHNPKGSIVVDDELFSWAEQFRVRENILRVTRPNVVAI
jgi:hypothetical protein